MDSPRIDDRPLTLGRHHPCVVVGTQVSRPPANWVR
jgi:hypothetical protein